VEKAPMCSTTRLNPENKTILNNELKRFILQYMGGGRHCKFLSSRPCITSTQRRSYLFESINGGGGQLEEISEYGKQ